MACTLKGCVRLGSEKIRNIVCCVKIARYEEGFFANAQPGIAFPDTFVSMDERGELVFRPLGPDHRARWSAPCTWEGVR